MDQISFFAKLNLLERWMRSIFAAAVVLASILDQINGTFRLILMIVSVYFALTAALGRDPIKGFFRTLKNQSR